MLSVVVNFSLASQSINCSSCTEFCLNLLALGTVITAIAAYCFGPYCLFVIFLFLQTKEILIQLNSLVPKLENKLQQRVKGCLVLKTGCVQSVY